MININKYKIT